MQHEHRNSPRARQPIYIGTGSLILLVTLLLLLF